MKSFLTIVDVIRVTQSDHGTFGVLVLRGEAFCVTLELPWRDNKRDVSCIPTGSYLCQRTESRRFGDAFLVRNVPERSHILFHKGNWIHETLGCILLGQRFGNHMIHDSRKAFDAFMLALNDRGTFRLNIKECLC